MNAFGLGGYGGSDWAGRSVWKSDYRYSWRRFQKAGVSTRREGDGEGRREELHAAVCEDVYGCAGGADFAVSGFARADGVGGESGEFCDDVEGDAAGGIFYSE